MYFIDPKGEFQGVGVEDARLKVEFSITIMKKIRKSGKQGYYMLKLRATGMQLIHLSVSIYYPSVPQAQCVILLVSNLY